MRKMINSGFLSLDGVTEDPRSWATFDSGSAEEAVQALQAYDGMLMGEMGHEGVSLVVIQRQLGYANLGVTSVYLQGINSAEIIDTVHGRPSPVISASAGLQISR